MTIIDTHSHIYGEEFATDADDVVARAAEAGVEKIFLPNINADTIAPMLRLAARYPGRLYPMIGLHPEDVRADWRDVLQTMEQQLRQPAHPYIGIGEVGLDYYWDTTFAREQAEAFATQVEWGLRYDLPLMIHTRSAHREMLSVIKSALRECPAEPRDGAANACAPRLRGVFHCFGGTADEARELLACDDFMLGIGGIVTFRRSALPDVLREAVPLTRIVVETDSPYLAPVPHRGRRNESAYAVHVVEALAKIYGTTTEKVAALTTANALQTFARVR